MKNLVATAAIVFGLVGVIVLVVHNRSDDGAPVPLPNVNDIEKIAAQLHEPGFGIHAVPSFEVPREHFGTLLGAISPAEKSSDTRGLEEFGELTITTKTGEVFQIVLAYWGWQAHFPVNGVHCMRAGPFQPLIVPQRGEGTGTETKVRCSRA